MKLQSIILGVAMTAVLLCVLVATRMIDVTPVAEDFQIREVDSVSLPEPDEMDVSDEYDPVGPVELEPPSSLSPPDAVSTLSVSAVTLPDVHISMIPDLSMNGFSVDAAPAPLPVVKVEAVVTKPKVVVVAKEVSKPKNPVKQKAVAKPTQQKKYVPKAAPPVTKKSIYSASELDQKLVWKYSPKVTFPRSIRDTDKGRVVVDIIISPSGKTKLTSVVSSTHPDLVSLAKRLANGSRFSKPTHQGQPVTVTKRWPIVIQK